MKLPHFLWFSYCLHCYIHFRWRTRIRSPRVTGQDPDPAKVPDPDPQHWWKSLNFSHLYGENCPSVSRSRNFWQAGAVAGAGPGAGQTWTGSATLVRMPPILSITGIFFFITCSCEESLLGHVKYCLLVILKGIATKKFLGLPGIPLNDILG
jgi:hypothetical protein